MTAQTVLLLVFLVLMKDSSCNNPFKLEERTVKAVEGSCAELKCSVTTYAAFDSHWFWIKDGEYNKTRFEGTIIYSSGPQKRPVSPGYESRVNYTGSTNWQNVGAKPTCSVLICNLNKSDSGEYAFRYIKDKQIWITNPNITLNVIENPCPITFEKPAAVNDSDTITLKCSTLSSCSSELQIDGAPQSASSQPLQIDRKQKGISRSFKVYQQDDGKEVSCQTRGNDDSSLIRKTRLTVQYAPRDVSAVISPQGMIRERQSVTLTCNAKGNPTPTFTWFVNGKKMPAATRAELKFVSIPASRSGKYACEARNILGSSESSSVSIDVSYPPEVKVTSSDSEFTTGERMALTCTVIRSKPDPTTYSWSRGSEQIGMRKTIVVQSVTPEHKGSYTCTATNTVGPGTSAGHEIKVRYRPRMKISHPQNNLKVKVGDALTFTCEADAYPPPFHFSWYRFNTDRNRQTDHSQWKPGSPSGQSLRLERVQRTDEACYVCNATNNIGTGEDSEPVCIQVLYPPTTPLLFMDDLVKEGQRTTINCTVESSPPSQLTLKRQSGSNPPEVVFTHSSAAWDPNKLIHTFNATSNDYGLYTCEAVNSIDSRESDQKQLVVKYRPNNVIAKYQPSVVNENTQLELSCSAVSHLPVKSFTWMKTKDGKSKNIGNAQTMTVKSVSPSDSGLYSCTAWNEMGSGESQQVEIKVRYAPKLTKIIRGTEKQQPNGRSSVTLRCTSDGYPEVKNFVWYKKIEERRVEVSKSQTHTVYSDQPGDYYCIAKNEINEKSSEPVEMFVDRNYVKILIIFFLLMMLVILLFFIIYRHRRRKSIQRGNSNTPSSFGSLSWWNSIGRRNEPITAEPFRSRDDLLTDQPHHPNGQRRQQSYPDNMTASSIYYTVNLPAGQQGPPGEMPVKQKARHTQDESLNYASINFKNKEKQMKKPAEVDAVYAVVSKNKTPKKTVQENKEDYENLKTAHAAKSPNQPSSDSDTSEDEVELNYSKVSFKPNPGHQRANRDSSSTSSTSSEEETQYSQVKI